MWPVNLHLPIGTGHAPVPSPIGTGHVSTQQAVFGFYLKILRFEIVPCPVPMGWSGAQRCNKIIINIHTYKQRTRGCKHRGGQKGWPRTPLPVMHRGTISMHTSAVGSLACQWARGNAAKRIAQISCAVKRLCPRPTAKPVRNIGALGYPMCGLEPGKRGPPPRHSRGPTRNPLGPGAIPGLRGA